MSKLVLKYLFGKKLLWIKYKDVNGNWGYLNTKTGVFRTTLPNSKEERLLELIKKNKAVLKTYSANKARFDNKEGKRRNHSDETVKKLVRTPIITSDSKGNISTGYSKPQLAPGEDSAQIDSTLEGLFIGDKLFKLGSGITKLALTKTGNNTAAHWARNSLANELTDLVKITSVPKNTLAPKIILELETPVESITYFKPRKTSWSNGTAEGNKATSYYFKNLPSLKFEVVKDVEPNNYSIHFKTDLGVLPYGKKMLLFAKVADEVPEGGNISTWGSISKGGLHGINRFEKDFGFNLIGTRQLTMKGTGEIVDVPIFLKPSGINPLKDALKISNSNMPLKNLVSDDEMKEIMHIIKMNADRNIEGWGNGVYKKDIIQYLKTGMFDDDPILLDLGDEYARAYNLKSPKVTVYKDMPLDLLSKYSSSTKGLYVYNTPDKIYLNEKYFGDKSPSSDRWSTALHETEHMYQNLVHPYTKDLEKILHTVYVTPEGSTDTAANIVEKGATNKEYLGKLYQMAKNYYKKDKLSLLELNDFIDTIEDRNLYTIFKSTPNSYGITYNNMLNKLPKSSLKNWVKNFRYSLKYMPATIPVISKGINNNQE